MLFGDEKVKQRKYVYGAPRDTKEHIEAIYEELRDSPGSGQTGVVRTTLKDVLSKLLEQIRNAERERRSEKENESYTIRVALILLGILSLALILNGTAKHGDSSWIDDHRLAIRLWGMALAAVFVGIVIEQSSFFKTLWSFGMTKVAASIAVSTLVVFCTGRASSLINSVFAVDASAMPYARAITTGLLVFQYAYPLLIIVAIFALLHVALVAFWIHARIKEVSFFDEFPVSSLIFSVLAPTVLWFSTTWVRHDFSEEKLPSKVYMLARKLDFNSNYDCANLEKGYSVVFLGQAQERVLVDAGNVETDSLESFIDEDGVQDASLPPRFYLMPCLPPPRTGQQSSSQSTP